MTRSQRDAATRSFAQGLRKHLRAQEFKVTALEESGNITDAPGFVFDAEDRVTGQTFNIEVAGEPYEE